MQCLCIMRRKNIKYSSVKSIPVAFHSSYSLLRLFWILALLLIHMYVVSIIVSKSLIKTVKDGNPIVKSVTKHLLNVVPSEL